MLPRLQGALDRTRLHQDPQIPGISSFYPNLYPEIRHSEAATLYLLVAGKAGASQENTRATFQAGYAGSIPVARST